MIARFFCRICRSKTSSIMSTFVKKHLKEVQITLLSTNALALLCYIAFMLKWSEHQLIFLAHTVFSSACFIITLAIVHQVPKGKIALFRLFFDSSFQYLLLFILQEKTICFRTAISIIQLYNVIDIATKIFPQLTIPPTLLSYFCTFNAWAIAILEVLMPVEVLYRFLFGSMPFMNAIMKFMVFFYFYNTRYNASRETRVIFDKMRAVADKVILPTKVRPYYVKLTDTLHTMQIALSQLSTM